MDSKNTIMNTGYALVGVGISKIDTPLIGLGLILIGVALQILVPVLNKAGIDAQSDSFNG